MHAAAVLVLMLLVWPTVAAGQTPAAEALADAFVQAWNTHDVPAFGRLYADDADWVTAGGQRHKGRDAVERALAQEHATWARTTVLRSTNVATRAIDAAHAVVMFEWEIARADASAGRPLRGNTLIVAAKRDGRWMIVAGQAAAIPVTR